MPDITLCTNQTCPLAKGCLRANLRPDPWQSWARFEPVEGEFTIRCDYFLAIDWEA